MIVFWFAVVGRTFVPLFWACFRIRFQAGVRYVTYFLCLGKNFAVTLSCGSWCFPRFLGRYIWLYCNLGWIGWRCIIAFGVENRPLVVTLPRSSIQILVLEAHFRIKFSLLWHDSYIRRMSSLCEVTHLHAMKPLRIVDATFAYQMFVVR